MSQQLLSQTMSIKESMDAVRVELDMFIITQYMMKTLVELSTSCAVGDTVVLDDSAYSSFSIDAATRVVGHWKGGPNRRFYSGFEVFRSMQFLQMLDYLFTESKWTHEKLDSYSCEEPNLPPKDCGYGFDIWSFKRNV